MEPEDTPPMSGSNSLCVATVVLETGIVPMREPETRLVMEAPGWPVEAVAGCRDGRVQRVRVTNVASFVDQLDAALEVEGIGTLTVDMACGGDSFTIVDSRALGFALTPDEARDLAMTGVRITRAKRATGLHPPRESGMVARLVLSVCGAGGNTRRCENGTERGFNSAWKD